MSAHATSISTLDLVHLLERYWSKSRSDFEGEESDEVEEQVEDAYSTFFHSYLPVLNGAVGWLPKIEEAINASVPDEMVDEENEGQWLDAESAYNAKNFLQSTADLLPGEPYIYGTPLGDFVAEFVNDAARLTSVVSAQKTLLVGVCRANPKEPVQSVIPRGSNRLRDEVREFTRKLAAVHGEALEP